MKQLPDILTSIQFWSSIATLWAAAGAWFTFFAAAKAARQRDYEDTLNLISGVEAELGLVSNWASGGENEVGYLQTKTKEDLTREHKDWFYPSRQIFSLDTPSLRAFTTSAQLRRLTDIVGPLIRLNHSIRRVFDLHGELRSFVHHDTHLYGSVMKKLANLPTFTTWTQDEQVYTNVIFGMNLQIHQELIGGADSKDEQCLYKAFRAAARAVADVKAKLEPEKLPRWYWLLHVVAGYLAFNGFWQVWRWLDMTRCLRVYF